MPSPSPGRPTVLLLGNYRATVTIARRLSENGHRVIVTRDEGGLAAVSRATAEIWDAPSPEPDEGFVEALAAYLRARPEISVVMPVLEPHALALARGRKLLPADRVYATPPDEVVLACADKIAMLELVARAGVPSAPAQVVTGLEALFSAAAEIGFPVIVRPPVSRVWIAGRKALIVPDEAALRAALREWPPGHEQLIVQRYVSGPRYNIDFAAQRGELIRAVATRVLRTDAPDGTGFQVCGETVPMPDRPREVTRRLVAALGYHGVGAVQIIDGGSEGEATFLELNPRFGASAAVPDRAGLELWRLAIELAATPDRPQEHFESAGGLRHVWSYGDLKALKGRLAEGRMGVHQLPAALWPVLRDALGADVHVVWSWRDPVPALSQFAASGRNALRRLFARPAGRGAAALPAGGQASAGDGKETV